MPSPASAGRTDGSEAGPATGPASGLPDGVQVWLVRHGETEWSRTGRHTGRTDIALTPTGEQQARAVREVLAGLGADLDRAVVLCSPRVRARDTARLAGLTVDEIDGDLAEWDYGDYEGQTTAEIREHVPDWTLWRDGVPGGEAIEEVSARADRVVRRADQLLRDADRPVVLVAHGHISRVIGARWMGFSAAVGGSLLLSTAAPSLLSTQYGQRVLARWNLPNPVAWLGRDTAESVGNDDGGHDRPDSV